MHGKPEINVTPLIDVLLVLLIIFMVISPIKPTDFKARIPAEPNQNKNAVPHDNTLVVSLSRNSTLLLNRETDLGNVTEPDKLIRRLSEIFAERTKNRVYSDESKNFGGESRVEKTVFIKAPRATDFGSVAKMIDAVKRSGAEPISLQIDDLD